VAKMGTFNRLPPISGHFFFARLTNRNTLQHQQGCYGAKCCHPCGVWSKSKL